MMYAPCLAQSKVSGRVLNIFTKQPVPKATVFLSNATNGTATDEAGNFTLTNVKRGQYDLVVTSIGYEALHQSIIVNTDVNTGDLLLATKSTELHAVTIKSDPRREQYLQEFKREFLGNSEFTPQCKILNLDILNVDNDRQTNRLTANADNYLEIVNDALGYRIKYFLNDFIKDRDSSYIYYAGSSVFEDLKGSAHQIRKWAKNRRKAYYGSPMHFLRSCIANNLDDQGFKALRLIVKPNPLRKPDSLIRTKLRHFMALHLADSVTYWNEQLGKPKMAQFLISTPLDINEYVRRTDVAGIYGLGLTDHLYVIYTKKNIDNAVAPSSYHPLNAPDYPTAIATFKKQYAFFDSNGIIIDPFDIVYEGFWTASRIAEMLPVDYAPDDK